MTMAEKNQRRTYVEWLSSEELHKESKKWISQLKFTKDEQRFLNNLIKEYTLDLTDAEIFKQVKPVITALTKAEKDINQIFKRVQLHKNQPVVHLER